MFEGHGAHHQHPRRHVAPGLVQASQPDRVLERDGDDAGFRHPRWPRKTAKHNVRAHGDASLSSGTGARGDPGMLGGSGEPGATTYLAVRSAEAEGSSGCSRDMPVSILGSKRGTWKPPSRWWRGRFPRSGPRFMPSRGGVEVPDPAGAGAALRWLWLWLVSRRLIRPSFQPSRTFLLVLLERYSAPVSGNPAPSQRSSSLSGVVGKSWGGVVLY